MAEKVKKPFYKKWWVWLIAIILIIGIANSGDEEQTASGEETVTETDSNEVENTEEGTTEEAETEEATEEPVEEEEEVVEEVEEEEPVVEDTNSTYADYADYHIPLLTEETLALSQESYDYIVSNSTHFPAQTDEAIQSVKAAEDQSVTIKHLNKNVNPYLSTVLSFTGTVISIEEVPIEETDDTLALIHVMDDEGNSYQVILYKTTGDILEEDYVHFWGVPVGPSYFENVSGGTTNVQVFMGSHIEKLQ
ncbi:hypothetical protein GH741_00290 [Aquibacillus halophilus]|uniref:Uncharacterized protein n=1 Tax=Aquibacillus halophilus TaxID=930132 RepID=A0A6A8D759_9BACI|nr:hypothetical protein [Aquibacillus halophilus]MRH41110.1 hypothetical protein [Aquibacillus halophilus]